MPKHTSSRASSPVSPARHSSRFYKVYSPLPTLHKDLTSTTRTPRIKRSLPDQFFEALREERESGHPHRFTTKEVQAIVRYVSDKPIDLNAHRFPTQADYDRLRDDNRRFLDRFRAERDQAQSSRLIDRIEKRPLAERIAPPTYTPIAPKPVLIDFKKHSVEDLIGIFEPCLLATLKRIEPLFRLAAFDDLTTEERRIINDLGDRLEVLHNEIGDRAPKVSHEEWKSLKFGLKLIGETSFKSLRRNYHAVIRSLISIYNGNYFDWINTA